MDQLRRWWQFIVERFTPLSTLPMIFIFCWSHFLLAQKLWGIPFSWISWSPVFVTATLFLFKLRLYDEIKDYEVDVKINPTRPLPRGLLKHSDIYFMIKVCIIAEIFLMGWKNIQGLIFVVLAIVYSLLMFKEFFIGPWLRPLLTTYAMTHTFVTFWLSLTLLSGFAPLPIWIWPKTTFLFALNSWWIFNLFEFSRKTFIEIEERENVDSYSNVWGRYGAILLSSAMSWASYGSLFPFLSPLGSRLLLAMNLFYLVFGLFCMRQNRSPWGMLFRSVSGVVQITLYLVFILC